jgi:hypothetical protein
MRMSSVREFRDNATSLLRSRSPILITRRGRLAGIFFPKPESSLPVELKREIFPALAGEVARQLRKVHGYAAALARKKRLPPDTVLTAVVTSRTTWKPSRWLSTSASPCGPTTTTSRMPGSPGTRRPRF